MIGEAQERLRLGGQISGNWQCPICLDDFAFDQPAVEVVNLSMVLTCGVGVVLARTARVHM